MQKNRLRWILLVVALVLIGALSLLLKPKKALAPVPAPSAATTAIEFLPQEVITVVPSELSQNLSLSGSLKAVDQASVKARVAGDIREILVREGESVQAGQIIVKMDSTEYQAKVEQARGNLNASRAQLDIATKTRDNNRALLEKGFISRNAFDNAESQYAVAQANVDAARSAVDIVQKLLNDTIIRAPISGMVASRSVQPGEKVSPDNRLLDILNLQKIEMEAVVPTSEIGNVALGQTVRLRVDGLDESFSGRVVRINPATQSGSRSILVYIQVANPQNKLRSGMFAEAQLTLHSKANVLALPVSAVHKTSQGAYVYAIENGLLVKNPVTLGIEGKSDEEARIEMTAGVISGAQIIKNDMGNLRTGSKVHITAAK